jgi:hypothetical protein
MITKGKEKQEKTKIKIEKSNSFKCRDGKLIIMRLSDCFYSFDYKDCKLSDSFETNNLT